MLRRAFVLFLTCCPFLAYAGMPKQVDVWEGLLPAGFTVTDAATPVEPAQLRSKTLAVVASANFENITRMWVDFNERGGAQAQARNLAMLGGALGAAGMAGSAAGVQQGLETRDRDVAVTRMTSDPRNVSDKVVAALSPYFGKVVSAPDFASALDQHADYIALIDFYGTMYPPMVNTRYRANGSVHLLNPSLQQLLNAEGKADIDREGDGLFSAPSTIVKGTAETFAKGIQITTDQIVEGIHAKLGPPPAPLPAPATPPAMNSTPMAQCIELCKTNTSRTAEQCFDACNK